MKEIQIDKTNPKRNTKKRVEIIKDDLPLHCPMYDQTLWDSHPKVYLPIEHTSNGEEACPYCGTVYVLK